jgi:hypothetical protein
MIKVVKVMYTVASKEGHLQWHPEVGDEYHHHSVQCQYQNHSAMEAKY